MKSHSSVRRPSLVETRSVGDSNSKSVGETLRKAKRDLFFRRCLIAIFIVLLVTLIAALFLLGYMDQFVDKIISLVE